MADLNASPEKLSDRELLVRLDERVKKIDECLRNHLAHHWAMSIGIFIAFVSAVAALLCRLIGG